MWQTAVSGACCSSIRAWTQAVGRCLRFLHQQLQNHVFQVAQHPVEWPCTLAGKLPCSSLRLHDTKFEVWRRRQSDCFLINPHREAVDAVAAGVHFDASQTEIARRLFDGASSEERGVMLGGAFSLAACEKMFRKLPKHAPVDAHCPFCKCAGVPSWRHLAWTCNYFAEDRGSLQMPACTMSWRLGWPLIGESLKNAQTRLQFLARVRAAIMEHALRA